MGAAKVVRYTVYRGILNRAYGIQLGAKIEPLMGITCISFFQFLVFRMNLRRYFGYWYSTTPMADFSHALLFEVYAIFNAVLLNSPFKLMFKPLTSRKKPFSFEQAFWIRRWPILGRSRCSFLFRFFQDHRCNDEMTENRLFSVVTLVDGFPYFQKRMLWAFLVIPFSLSGLSIYYVTWD